jgi:alcohol dehydrogenase
MSQQPRIIQSSDFIVSMLEVIQPGKVLLITSKGFSKRGLVQKIQKNLGADNVVVHNQITPNPELADIQRWAETLGVERFSNIVVLGGGSAIDTGKVLSRLLIEPGQSLKSMLNSPAQEVKKGILLIAIPTTSGTGAEVTPFATVWDRSVQKKHSLTQVAPDIAILDPSLTLTLGHQDTLYPALDALSHALESLWNKNRTHESERFAINAIEKICVALPQVLNKPKNLLARKDIQCAATLAGLAISQTRTAIAHAISYPLTLKYGVPHGLACSYTIPAIIDKFGAVKLKLNQKTVDEVLELFDKISVKDELRKFVDDHDIAEQALGELEPSRMGNFIQSVSPSNVQSIIRGRISSETE